MDGDNQNEHEAVSDQIIDQVCAKLREGKPVKHKLPGDGLLNIDRLLPFLCVYRRNPRREDAGTELFVRAEAAYLNAPGNAKHRTGLAKLVRRIAQTGHEQFGGFLILEIWSSSDSTVTQTIDERTGELKLPAASFVIHAPAGHPRPEAAVAKLAYRLQRTKVHNQQASVDVVLHDDNDPPQMSQLFSHTEAEQLNCYVIGLEVSPIYRSGTELQPYVLRALREGVEQALKKAFFAFSLSQTNLRPQHHFALGRKSLPKLVWEVDRRLAEVSSQFKFLLQATPINAERSWHAFRDSGYSAVPQFEYRPLDTDPLLIKRELLQIPTEQIEDPTLSHLFRQTQDELDRQIGMLADIGTTKFLPGSLQVFGGVDQGLLHLALQILQTSPSQDDGVGESLSANEFAKLANGEIRDYQSQLPSFSAQAIVREDMYSGLLCSGGNLLIGRETSISVHRAQALLQHEIGTHLVTYYNGAQQPMKLLRVGLAGYDGLQEGLAVLSEYLVGGLNRTRLRLLAARVIAVHDLISGATFVETYRRLVNEFTIEPHGAYTIVMRVYRGGGLTKDAVYLRGLCEVLKYVRGGGDLERLLVGKIAVDHISIIKELQLRSVLKPAPVVPRYLRESSPIERLAHLRGGNGSVLDLMVPTTMNGVTA